MTSITPVTLANCEDEPIHVPGAIQPHGALIALRADGMVLAASENIQALLGFVASPGSYLTQEQVGPEVLRMLEEGLTGNGPWSNSVETRIGEHLFDVIGHSYKEVFYLEFEIRTADTLSITSFTLNAQRIIAQVQLHNDTASLLSNVTDELRRMTGYDRVMAYRFRHDDSGEVVAESRREDLESYLGQRYPASDIPAQARRLYIQNPIRLIADVAYTPMRVFPALNPETNESFDLSYSVLRSVSPIHCEYLTNMGVRASMSISIVVGGKLWGLFSCHHMSPKLIPYPVRMSFQIFSQVCSAIVERLEQGRIAELLRVSTERRLALARRARDADDLFGALAHPDDGIAALIPCDGALVMLGGRTLSIRGDFERQAGNVLQRLQRDPERDIYHTDNWPQPSVDSPDGGDCCGVLAIRFHRQESGWIFWFRHEEVHRIRWGGKPEKLLTIGPSGPRLTPRGSFEAWEEVVRGHSTPWSETDLAIAEKLRLDLMELCLNHAAEVDRMRQRLIAVLGHDLRNPLQSISMAAALLSSSDTRTTELRQHISASSSRMERLVSQILDMSRLQSGIGLTVNPVDTDVSQLVRQIVCETDVAYPGLVIEIAIDPQVRAVVDPDRYAQVAANLLSNARHHGLPGRPVLVTLTRQGDEVCLSVLNETSGLSEAQLANLFEPFKRESADNQRNRNGLGIGLYISQAIAQAHQGRIDVDCRDDVITFLPAPAGAPGGDRLLVLTTRTVHNATLAGIFGSHRHLTGSPRSMPRLRLRTVLACLAVFCAAPALARVEVHSLQHKSMGRVLTVRVSEEIAPGDYETLLKGLRNNPGTYSRKLLLLNSIGGSVPEAIRMGRLLRESGFDALVPSSSVCQGTCVYLLAAGKRKTVRGYVGLHRPYYAHGDSLHSRSANGMRYDSAAYFREMDIPSTLVQAMQSTDPKRMRVLSAKELAQYRLN